MKRKKLSKSDKWIVIVAINGLAACISGLLLAMVGIFVSPPAQETLMNIFALITIAFLLISMAIYCPIRIIMIFREAKERKLVLQSEKDRLSQMLNDLKK